MSVPSLEHCKGERLEMDPAEKIKNWAAISPNLTAEQLTGFLAHEKERQSLVPAVGTQAPDFELDVLDRDRQRTGERFRLSSWRGKPVGLIFGSWT